MLKKSLSLAVGMAIAAPVLAQDFTLEEIVVTAQKRAQSLQEVPLAITAIGGDSLKESNITNVSDIGALSSSVDINAGQSATSTTSIRIRGIGTVGNNLGFESSVGVFIDGVYQPRPGVALSEFVDMAQVEVLRGPQGTLFGRNTSVGALSISTNKPEIGDSYGSVSATLGNYDLYNMQGFYNASLSDTAAVRVAGSWRERDGVVENLQPGEPDDQSQDRQYLRLQALFEPTDTLSINLSADYAKTDEICCSAAIVTEDSILAADLDPSTPGIQSFYAGAGLPGHGGVLSSGDSALDNLEGTAQKRTSETEAYNLSAEIVWDLGWAELTSLTGYGNFTANEEGGTDFVGLDAFRTGPQSEDNIESWSQEFRLQGVAFDERLDWMVGAYYSSEEIDSVQHNIVGEDFQAYNNAIYQSVFAADDLMGGTLASDIATLIGQTEANVRADTLGAISGAPGANLLNGAYSAPKSEQEGTSWSIFTHNIFSVTDQLTWTLGLRYVDEEKTGSVNDGGGLNAACNLTAGTNLALMGASSDPLIAAASGLATANLCLSAFTSFAQVPFADSFETDFDDNQLTYTTNLQYAFTDDINAYIGFTHGFKSGGINLSSTAVINLGGGTLDPTFDSEEVDSWEIGIRSTLLEGRLTANLTLFDMDVENFQLLNFTGSTFEVFNTPLAESQGAELELTYLATENLTLNLAYSYTDTSIDYQDGANGCAEIYTGAPGVASCGSGELPNAPRDVAIFGLRYEREISDNLQFTIAPSVNYERSSGLLAEDASYRQPDTVIYNLTATLGDVEGVWSLNFWGKNLSDERQLGLSLPGFARGSDALGSGSRYSFAGEPRTFGATYTYNF